MAPAVESQDMINNAMYVSARGSEGGSGSSEDKDTKVQAMSQPDLFNSVQIVYDYNNGSSLESIFTPSTLADMCTFENILPMHPNYEKFCIRPSGEKEQGNCTMQTMSVLRFFYDRQYEDVPVNGTRRFTAGRPLSHIDQLSGEDTNYRNCTSLLDWEGPYGVHAGIKILDGMIENKLTRPLGGFFVSSSALDADEKATFSALTRSMLQVGGPLPGLSFSFSLSFSLSSSSSLFALNY
jgi:hypothetical protein